MKPPVRYKLVEFYEDLRAMQREHRRVAYGNVGEVTIDPKKLR